MVWVNMCLTERMMTDDAEMPFRVFEHTADIGFDVWGGSLSQLFEHALQALAYLLTDEYIPEVKEPESREWVSVESGDCVALLVDFLSEVLVLSHSNKLVYPLGTVEVIACRVEATVRGVRREFVRDVKAITYHEAQVKVVNGRWWGHILVDV